MADEAGIRSAAAGMGAGETTELFAGVLTQRPWSQVLNPENSHLLSTPHCVSFAVLCWLSAPGPRSATPLVQSENMLVEPRYVTSTTLC